MYNTTDNNMNTKKKKVLCYIQNSQLAGLLLLRAQAFGNSEGSDIFKLP